MAPRAAQHDAQNDAGLAEQALQHGSAEAALRIASGVVSQDPKNVQALLVAGEASYQLREWAHAEGYLKEALALEPDSVRGARDLRRVRVASDPVGSERLLRQALAGDAKNPVLLTDLGVALDLQGNHEAAQAQYQAALVIAPTSVAAKTNLGLSMALSGKAAEGGALIAQLAQVQPESSRIRADLALAYAVQGDRDGAAQLLSRDMPLQDIDEAVAGYAALAQ